MKGSADGKYWGNSLTPAQPALVPRDRWQCVEVMLQCNSAPDKSDGELALWLDGKRAMHVGPGVRRSRWTGMGFSLAEPELQPWAWLRQHLPPRPVPRTDALPHWSRLVSHSGVSANGGPPRTDWLCRHENDQ
jgi:hypothetical protein